jgi:integrase
VDFTDFMLATGLRIGEVSAVTWDALDLNVGTVEVHGTVARVTGSGPFIKAPKSKSGHRILELPDWAVTMLRRRQNRQPQNRWNAVGTAPAGGLLDPSNTQSDLREAFDTAGYTWVTSHIYRKTVATIMDAAGLTARQAAHQLGHAKVSMTQDNYFGRKVARTGAARVSEMFGAATEHESNPGGKLGVDHDGTVPPGA